MTTATTGRRCLALRAGLHAHASGALWIESERTLVVADLHLGFGWAQRRRGQLGPVADDKAGTKLFAAVEELGATTVVFAGDLVHAPRPCDGERVLIESILRQLAARATVVVVAGNHDRAFAADFASLGLERLSEWRSSGLVVVHGDRVPPALSSSETLVLGHVHPVGIIVDAAGVSHKLPLFIVGRRLILLPAFSPFAGGFEIGDGLPPELEEYAGNQRLAIAATGSSVAPLGPPRSLYLS